MKTKVLTAISMVLVSLVSAQPPQVDTIKTYLNRASGFNLEPSTGGGFMFGTGYFLNNLVTGETGLHYTSVGNATVLELLVWFGNVYINGNSDLLTANVYDVSSDSMPNNLLGSGQLFTSSINANPNTLTYTSISITTGGGITNDFFVSLDYESFDDTIGIMTSNPANNDGLGEHRMRQRELLLNQWRFPESIWFVPYDADAIILPVLDIGNGVSEIILDGIKILKTFPNPAADYIDIYLDVATEKHISVKFFDLNGRLYYDTKSKCLGIGSNKIHINTRDWPDGNYYYTISSSGKSITGRCTVIK